MGSHFVRLTKWDPIEYYFYCTLHVAKYNLIVIIASCLDVCCVLMVCNILYKFDIHNGMASQNKKKKVIKSIQLNILELKIEGSDINGVIK